MAGIKLNTLPSATVVQDDDYLMIEQREGTKKTKVSDINKKTNDLVKSLDTKVVETEKSITTLSSQMEEISKQVEDGAVNVSSFGAVGDYYLNDGSINPNPTDNSEYIQNAFNISNAI